MRNYIVSLFVLIALVSCANLPRQSVGKPVPPVPAAIMGQGLVRAEKMAAFLAGANPALDAGRANQISQLYIEESRLEGVNADVAFSQMCLETGFLKFGGLVSPDMNNFCGLGSIGPGQAGERFPSSRVGIRAHIQHLKGYASTEPLNLDLVDPRFRWIKYGTAPTVHDLAGRWAADKEYGEKITRILQRLYDFSFHN